MRFRLLLAATAALLLAAVTGSHASVLGGASSPASSASFRPVHHPSLSSLRAYELVAIDSAPLHRAHAQSIVHGAQVSSNPQAVRQFAKKVDFRFHTEAVHRVEAEQDGTDDAAAASASPRLFDYTLSKTEDLFGPDYTQTRQVWRNGKRFEEEETVTPLSAIEHCYYRGSSLKRSGDYLAFHTCSGGFTGLIVERGTKWIVEPAHLHFEPQQMQQHLQTMRAKRKAMHAMAAGAGVATAAGVAGARAEDLHEEHLHVVYRDADAPGSEWSCPIHSAEHDRPHSHAHSHSHSHAEGRSMHTMAFSTPLEGLSEQREFSPLSALDPQHAQAVGPHITEISPYAEHGWSFSPASAASASDSSPAAERHPFRSLAAGSPVKYLELFAVNDFQRFTLRGNTVEQETAAIVNAIKATYEATTAFNPRISIVLVHQATWQTADPYTTTLGQCAACTANHGASVDELLASWNSWRSNQLNAGNQPHDNAHLFSGYPFEGSVLGYAGVGVMCTQALSGGISTTLNQADSRIHAIATHEMGHNFGMNHDSKNNVCPQSGFFMNAVLQPSGSPTEFSSCSIDYEVNWMASSHITCMDNVPTAQWGAADCGNGFVEAGESCDCGNRVSCQLPNSRDSCCNATTCAFTVGSTCSASDGCCDNCQVTPASSAKVCRAAANSCDLPETCTGLSSVCPSNGGLAPGTNCDAGQYGPGLCYLNSCLSYLQQCRTAGANFQGAPFDTCTQQSSLNHGAYCSTLWCSSTPGVCTYFEQSPVTISMADGVPCPDYDGNLAFQCKAGACVNPVDLNANYYWNETGWTSCSDCAQPQYQNISCVDRTSDAVVQNAHCTPSTRPGEVRQCINIDIGCYGAAGRDSDIIDLFGYKQISRKTLIFATLGACVAFLTIMGCCYQAVTFQGENEELPGPSPDAMAVAAALKAADLESGASSVKAAPGAGTASQKKKKPRTTRVQQVPQPVL